MQSRPDEGGALDPATGMKSGGLGPGFGSTHMSGFSANNPGGSSLKGKLLQLEEHIRNITDEINRHKKEVEALRSEKQTLENLLSMKAQDVRKSISGEIARVEDEMKRNFGSQKAENSRLQQQITGLKSDKTQLQQQLLALQRRIAELELQVGADDMQ